MVEIIMAIALLCDGSWSCQAKLTKCVRDKISQTSGQDAQPDDLLWECSIKYFTK